MQIFDGRKEAQLLDEMMFKHMSEKKVPDGDLLIVQVGDDLLSEKFAGLKMNLCNKLGIYARYEKIEEDENDQNIVSKIRDLFSNQKVSGGIIQLPLPRFSIQNVLNEIPYNKDLDVLSETSQSEFYSLNPVRIPPTVRALNHFLTVVKANTQGLRVGVVGGGLLVGQPVSHFLLLNGAKVTIMDRPGYIRPEMLKREDISWAAPYVKGTFLDYDLVILSAGKPNLVDCSDIKSGSMVADFGSSVVEGRAVGDLNRSASCDYLSFLSPSPGGMGPLVIRYLIMNFLGL